MMASSHVIVGAVGWVATAHLLGQPLNPLHVVASAMAALTPDIDHPKSWLGSRLGIVSVAIASVVGHRGVTHSLLAVLTWGACLYTWGTEELVAPLAVGYLSHLLADALTPSGVPFLWPCKRRFGLALVTTGSWSEKALMLALLATLIGVDYFK
jgi:inner membrane protein